MKRSAGFWSAGLLLLVLLLGLWALQLGPVPLGTQTVVRGLFGLGNEQQQLIVQQVRLPRVLLAILVGAVLGMSGAALQGLLRNPLAEPGLLGISSSAGLGAVLALYFGITSLSTWLLPLSAMSFALLATLFLYWIARSGNSNLSLILAGVALSALAAACTSLALNLAPNPSDMQDMVMWLLGSLSDRSFSELQLCLPFALLGMALLYSSAPALDVLSLGEAEAQSLGVQMPRLRAKIIIGTALSVGACVAVTGSIGFIGLVVPHLLRRPLAYRPGKLLLVSALGGAALLLSADILLRLINSQQELMLGVVTALLGAPFFLLLSLSKRSMQS